MEKLRNQELLRNQIRDIENRRASEFAIERNRERKQLRGRCFTTDKHENRKKLLRQAWAKGTSNTIKQQMELCEMKQVKDKNDDIEYGVQLAKNLGFSKIGAKKATKEPSGTIMD